MSVYKRDGTERIEMERNEVQWNKLEDSSF